MKNTPQQRNRISWIRVAWAIAMLALAAVLVAAVIRPQSAQAQTFTTLHEFNGTDGDNPYAGLTQGADGNFYGTTSEGGANTNSLCFEAGDASTCGAVFKITPSGTLTTLYSFCSQSNCTDGSFPLATLVQATNGNFYGTTSEGGANSCLIGGTKYGCGTIFEITPTGTLTTLHSFNGADGNFSFGGLIQATDGNLYGTTESGGANGSGTLFKITSSGTLTTLYSFCSQAKCTDGGSPKGALIQAIDGNFYGTTQSGGAASTACGGSSCGTVFKITPSGTLTTQHAFDGTDGAWPTAGLIQATDGNFYGTTAQGGTSTVCTYGCGTVFRITPGGTLTTLHSFDSTDGSGPNDALIQATDGNFYATAYQGGIINSSCSTGCGTIFEITPSGTLTTLHSFDHTDGDNPYAGLVQGTNGTFYGAVEFGGNHNGTVFSLSVGLGPFVETQPTSGPVGAAVQILGTSLTGATSVSFNGTTATFTVVSGSEITTNVPAGATSGFVTVATPGGKLTSNVPFVVTGGAATKTATTLSSSPNPSPYGEAVTFTATVTSGAVAPPDGETVSFIKGTTVLGTGTLNGGTATFTTSTLKVGKTSIKAVYAGDSNFLGSKSKADSQEVSQATTSTALASSLNPSNAGQSVTFTATVTPEFSGAITGKVTFYDGTTVLKIVPVKGGASKFTTKTLTAGTHTITATYGGSTSFDGSSASLTQTVN